MTSHAIAVSVEAEVAATAEHAFATIAPIDLGRIFVRLGPLPGVRRTREQSGPWDAVGRTRVVELSDGSEARERLTAYDAPRHFGYRVEGFTGPLGRLVGHADGAWLFTTRPSGRVHVRWTYRFAPRPWCGPVVRLVVAPLWRPYARAALRRAVAIAERREA
jgi:hypothetical protein